MINSLSYCEAVMLMLVYFEISNISPISWFIQLKFLHTGKITGLVEKSHWPRELQKLFCCFIVRHLLGQFYLLMLS